MIFKKTYICNVLEDLRIDRKATKVQLGRVLDSNAKHAQSATSMYDRFVDPQNTRLDMDGLKKIADFYGIPIETFFGVAPDKEDPLRSIQKNLTKLGFSSRTVDLQVKLIKELNPEK